MVSSLSNLVNNFAERIHKIKCKYQHDNKKCENKYKDCKLKIKLNIKLNLIEFKYFCWNKTYQKMFDENLKKKYLPIHTIFLTPISISLFCCSEKVFTHTNI